MSTPDERVEVTPELLQRIEQWPANPRARSVLIADFPAAAVCKALVQRIRELESERQPWTPKWEWCVEGINEVAVPVENLDGTDAGWVTFERSDEYRPNLSYLRHLPPGSPEVVRCVP